MRLNKVLSNSGICSRRKADSLITDGLVKINGKIIVDFSTQISVNDVVEVNNKIININSQPRMWLYYKPIGYLVTNYDSLNRPIIFDHLSDLPRVITIGRLDLNSEGLLLLTNNGDLARKYELPSSKIKRIYKVRAYGDLSKLRPYLNKKSVIEIENVIYNIENIKLLPQNKKGTNSWFEVSLFEGKNRELRKIFEYFHLQVNRLIRTHYGIFELGNLKPGKYLEIENCNNSAL